MNPETVTFDVTYTESRSRLTSAFRYILALPHLLFAGLWGYAANILAILQWFVILFTGRRNQGMWDFQRAYLGYEVRVSSYASLLYDEYPNFGSSWRDEPVAFGIDCRPDANRLTNGLRPIWIIPALFISIFLGIAVFFVLFASWIVIIITGRHPRAMWDLIVRVYRFSFELSAYAMLMTDEYPRYDGSKPTSTLLPGDRPGTSGSFPSSTGTPLPPPSGPPAG
jgi:Domain of unknown function (DUF4389)